MQFLISSPFLSTCQVGFSLTRARSGSTRSYSVSGGGGGGGGEEGPFILSQGGEQEVTLPCKVDGEEAGWGQASGRR